MIQETAMDESMAEKENSRVLNALYNLTYKCCYILLGGDNMIFVLPFQIIPLLIICNERN